MNEDRRRILEMLKKGKISVSEADELLETMEVAAEGERTTDASPTVKAKPKFLRVLVEGKDHVDVRVPLQLLRAGIKLGGLIPPDARAKVSAALGEKGFNLDLSDINPETVEELIQAMGELSVNVEDDEEKVRVFCE